MKKNEKKLTMILVIITLALMTLLFLIDSLILTIFAIGAIFLMIWLLIEKFDIEKISVICFFIWIPFFVDFSFSGKSDFHLVAKEYYVINLLQAFVIVFLVLILKNIKKINIKLDIIILFLFVLICFFSGTYAINSSAAFFDSFRYLQLFIIYIYFSRVFDFKRYRYKILNVLVLGLVVQLVIGFLQHINNGPIGLRFLGEGESIFRIGDIGGLERGISGTFGHPGPLALYSCLILCWVLFDIGYNKFFRYVGIGVATFIILFSFSRATILMMLLVYLIYFKDSILKFNIKKLMITFFLIGGLIIVATASWSNITLVINRFLESDIEQQIGNRMVHYDIGFHYIEEKPLLGIGINNYLDKTSMDYPMDFEKNFYLKNPIHNIFLLYAVEIGIIGLSIYLTFILISIQFNKKNRRTDIFSNEDKIKLKGYNITILIYSIYNFQGWAGIQNKSLIMFILTVALSYNYVTLKKKSEVEEI